MSASQSGLRFEHSVCRTADAADYARVHAQAVLACDAIQPTRRGALGTNEWHIIEANIVEPANFVLVKPLPAAGLSGDGWSTAVPSLVSEVGRSSYGAPIALANVRSSYRDVRSQVRARTDMSRAHRIPSDRGDCDTTLACQP